MELTERYGSLVILKGLGSQFTREKKVADKKEINVHVSIGTEQGTNDRKLLLSAVIGDNTLTRAVPANEGQYFGLAQLRKALDKFEEAAFLLAEEP